MFRTAFLLLVLLPGILHAQSDLPRNDAAPGWSKPALKSAQDFAEKHGSTAGLILQHDTILYSWGNIARRSNIHSCRKSLLSALIGIAVDQHQIDLNRTLASLDIDDNPPSLTPEEKQARLIDMLEARSGVYHPTVYETKGMEESKPPRGSHAPGTFWYYNNWDFNTLGTIYEHATGRSIFQSFDAQIAKPIGMQDYRPKDGHYITDPGTRYPAYPIDMSARDLARFALLYLHQGQWNGKQIVPAAWVAASIHPYSDAPSGGYGYLWWTADSASGRPAHYVFPPGSFWAEGHLGQYALAIPSLDMVIVTRVDSTLTHDSMNKLEVAELVRLILTARDQK
jgi:CubicO group peptidase (beta-lactamase class C family)